MTLLGLYWVITLAAAVWTGCDDKRMREEGRGVWNAPVGTGLCVLLLMPVALPMYVARRSAVLRRSAALREE